MKTQIKPRSSGFFTALVLIAAVSAQADDQKENKDKGYRNETPSQTVPGRTDPAAPVQPSYRGTTDSSVKRTGIMPAHGSLGKVNKATGLIGMEVKNQQNEKLGKVDDLVIDLQSGRVAYAVISSGGFLGVGDKLIAVPTSAFTYAADENKLVLNADKQRLQSAPVFDKNNWTETPDGAWLGEVYRYHGQEPYWDRSGDRIRLRNEELNDTIENQRDRLNNPQDQFNRDANRVPGAPGTADRLPNNADQKSAEINNNTAAVDNTRRNERDRTGDTLTPEDQGKSTSDREVTRSIRKSIVVEKGPSPYSVNARNVKIMTTDGVVTLRGIVNSQAEKDSLEAKAKQVAGVTRVDNQLEVKSSSK